MTEQNALPTRRTVLTTIAAGGVVPLGGCAETNGTGSSASTADRIDVAVDETDLIVEFTAVSEEATLSVIDPNGEAFAEQTITPGASQATIELGTSYEPGEYAIQLRVEDEVVASATREIRPEIVLTDLKLGRNHPEEMYEGAGELTITAESILFIENMGTGPERITTLRFNGDVPRPTPDDFDQSGIMSLEDGVSYSEPVVGPGESKVIYSRVIPFSPSGEEVECTPAGISGQFDVTLIGSVNETEVRKLFDVSYVGEEIADCEITIEEVNS